jgi:hypothetical protein
MLFGGKYKKGNGKRREKFERKRKKKEDEKKIYFSLVK